MKNSKLFYGAGHGLMIVGGVLFFWKLLPFAAQQPGLVVATACILCFISAAILFILYGVAKKDEREQHQSPQK